MRTIGKAKNADDDWLSNSEFNPFACWIHGEIELTGLQSREDYMLELKTVAEIGQTVLSKYRALLNENQTMKQDSIKAVEEYSLDLKRTNDELNRMVSFWRERFENCRRELIEAESNLTSAQAEIKELRSISERYAKNSRQQHETSSVSVEQKISIASVSELTRLEADYEKKVLKLQAKVEDLQNIIRKFEQNSVKAVDYSELEEKYNSLKREDSKLSDRIRTLQAELENAKSQLAETDTLVNVVKEISESHTRVESELVEANRLLSESRDELNELRFNTSLDLGTPIVGSTEVNQPKNSSFTLFNSPPVQSIFGEVTSSLKSQINSGRETPETPVKMKSHSDAEDTLFNPTLTEKIVDNQPFEINNRISDTVPIPWSPDSVIEKLALLTAHLTQALQRINSTNTLALNRRLRKTFDLPFLTQLSNNILDHIENESCEYLTKLEGDDRLGTLVTIILTILKEVLSLRKRINDTESAYYSKLDDWSKADLERLAQKQLLERQISESSSPALKRSTSRVSFFGFPRIKSRDLHEGNSEEGCKTQ